MPHLSPKQSAQQGFTLLEVMVATFVFAVAVAAMVKVLGETANSQGYLEEKMFSALSAHNQMLISMLGDTATEGKVTNGRHKFRWQLSQDATASGGLVRRTIAVYREDAHDTQQLATLHAYVGSSK